MSNRRTSRAAVVIGRWSDDTALVRTDDGSALEVPVPEWLRAEFDVGARVQLDGDENRLVGLGGAVQHPVAS